MPRYPIHDALLEKADDDATFCNSCGVTAISDGPYCAACKDYWENDAPERDFWNDNHTREAQP